MLIRTENDIQAGLSDLIDREPFLRSLVDVCGEIPLRLRRPGLDGLIDIVIAQQVSKASAAAISKRFSEFFNVVTAEQLVLASEDDFRKCGLSRPKMRTLWAIGEALQSGQLDLDRALTLAPSDAIAHLSAVKGIGPWTAEVYLMFCGGHGDIFPAGDLALQIAVGEAYAMDERPSEKALRVFSERWQPNRAVAARLFWAYYQICRKGRDGMPV